MRRPRAERIGQDDAHATARRVRAPVGGVGRRRGSISAAPPAAFSSAIGVACSGMPTSTTGGRSRGELTAEELVACRSASPGQAAQRGGHGRASCWSGSGCSTARPRDPSSFRRATADRALRGARAPAAAADRRRADRRARLRDRGQVYALLAELVSEHGATALVVSHDPASTEIADRIVHIRDGRVSEERRGADETAVVGEGGWLRVPEEILHGAGIGSRVRIVARADAVELRPASGDGVPARTAATTIEGAPGGVLEAVGVSRRYGREVALDGVDARFEPGRLSVVTGPSGSGKSTLLALLAGLDVPDEGEVRLDGPRSPASTARARSDAPRAHLGRDAGPHLSDFLTARENVELVLGLRGIGRWSPTRWPAARSRRSSSPSTRTGAWEPCPPASASASRWPARSPPAPGSCSPTSRPRASTPGRRSSSETCSSASRGERGRRSSARRTTPPDRARGP